jgi:tetratricopeptide (TPR) repeat protein
MSAPRAIALCQCFNGALEYQAGHWHEAETALDESIRLYRQIGAASGEALACQSLGVLQTARGRLDEALAILEEGVVAAERALMRAHCLTRLYAAMARNRLTAGDLSAADQALCLGLAMGQRHGHCTTCDGLLLPAAVSVRVAQQDFEAAEVFCYQLDEAAIHYGSQMWLAMAHQARGELSAGRQEWEVALAAYVEAQQAFRAAGHDYEAARCLEAAAAVHMTRRSPGDSEVAAQARSQAGQILARLAAV